MADIAKMIEEIKTMTVVELNDLVKAIEEEFGVSAAAPVAVVGGGNSGVAAENKLDKQEKKKEQKAGSQESADPFHQLAGGQGQPSGGQEKDQGVQQHKYREGGSRGKIRSHGHLKGD